MRTIPNLKETAEALIFQSTHGRNPYVTVEIVDETIVVEGRTITYYIKQLVTESLRSLLEEGYTIKNNLTVG